MHRLGRVLGVFALLGTVVFAQAARNAPSAAADGSGGGAVNCSGGLLLCTAIQYTGNWQTQPRDPDGPGGGGSGAEDIPICWLQPQTAWENPDVDASSPAGLAQYFNDMAADWDHDPTFTAWLGQVNLIYIDDKGADPGIGLVAPNYNTGQTDGRWYGIACDPTATYGDYTAIQQDMGVSTANLPYEGWFWIKNPADIPSSVPQVTPQMLAGYAANHVAITASFPLLSPDVGTTQTVGLPVESVNIAGGHGYYTYSTTATLAGIFSTVTSYPVSVTYTASPGGLITPGSVTCRFNQDGSIANGCPTFKFTEPEAPAIGATLYATTTWDVHWNGSKAYGEGKWTEQLPGPDPTFQAVVTVQAIQAVNGGSPTP